MKLRKFGAGLLAAVLLLTGMPTAHAASSAEIRNEINDLEAEQALIQGQIDDLQQEQNANWESIEEMVAYKSQVDSQIFLLYAELDNLNQQITAYTTLIAQTQAELDAAQADLDELNVRYRARVRAMEEEGTLSYWEVLFKSKSFTDLIDRLNMIREIAEADERLMEQMRLITEEVARAKANLEAEKASLEASRAEQEAAMAELEAKRAESDAILQELNANHLEMEERHAELDAQKNAYANEIAQAEKEWYEAWQREEEERRRQEEEERRRQEEEQRREEEANNATRPTDPEDGEEPDGEEPEETEPTEPSSPKPPAKDEGWRTPCSYIMISSAYGYRKSGWHNGVDFANNRGTPIYATRSGTVTKAVSLTYSYGNHVVINHGDGFSSLYAHMDYYVVSAGQYVSQGQLIGYMGSTGNSTGNHLHFTIFYNGSDVNPMKYL